MDLVKVKLSEQLLDRLTVMLGADYTAEQMKKVVELINQIKDKVKECDKLLEIYPDNEVLNHNLEILIQLGGMLSMLTMSELRFAVH